MKRPNWNGITDGVEDYSDEQLENLTSDPETGVSNAKVLVQCLAHDLRALRGILRGENLDELLEGKPAGVSDGLEEEG